MANLKRISSKAVPAALEKALRYRLLNEPVEAESICRDVLAVAPDNEVALRTLLLALTDQFETDFHTALDGAREVLTRLATPYDREYYEGIIHERWAKAQRIAGVPNEVVCSWLRQAMGCFTRAETHATADESDPVLRWNTCVRLLERCEDAGGATEGAHRDIDAEYADEAPLE